MADKVFGRFVRTSNGRLSYELDAPTSDRLLEVVKLVDREFGLTVERGPAAGLESVWMDARTSSGHSLKLGWDIWSGVVIMSDQPEGDGVVRAIGEHLDGVPANVAPSSDLPLAKTIAGTVWTEAGRFEFWYDTDARRLKIGPEWLDRTPSRAGGAQVVRLIEALTEELGEIRDLRIGWLNCRACAQWFDVLRKPGAWSYGMCLSCSLETSSEMGE